MAGEQVIIPVSADLSGLIAQLNKLEEQFAEFKGSGAKAGESVKQAFTGTIPSVQNTTKALKELDTEIRQVDQDLKKVADPTAKANLEKYRAELAQEEKALQNVGVKAKNLRTEMRELTQQLAALAAQGKQGSTEFNRLAQRAGVVKNAMDDARGTMKALGSDTKYLDGAIQGVQGLVGAFSIFQGVMMLVGDENKDFQRAMLQMMATMQVLNGVQQVANILQKESSFMQTLMALKTKITTSAIFSQTSATVANNIANKAASKSGDELIDTASDLKDQFSGLKDSGEQLSGVLGGGAAGGAAGGGVAGSMAGVAAMGVAAIAMLGALVYAMANFNETQAAARYETDEWKKANDALNESLNITRAGLVGKITKVAQYIEELKKQGKTQAQLAEDEIRATEKDAEALAVKYELQAKTLERQRDEAKQIEQDLRKKQGYNEEQNKLTLDEINQLNAVQNTIAEKNKQIIQSNNLAKQTREDALKYATAARIEIDTETRLAEQRKEANKETKNGNKIVYDNSIVKKQNNKITIDSVTATDQYTNSNKGLTDMLKAGLITQQAYNEAIESSGSSMQYIRTATDQFTKELSQNIQAGKDYKEEVGGLFNFSDLKFTEENFRQIISGLGQLAGQISNIIVESQRAELDKLLSSYEETYNSQEQLLKDRLNNELISQEEYDKKVLELEKKKNADILAAKRAAWKKEQDAKLAMAIINTAVGATEALAEGGVAGIITGALVAAAGAIEIGYIAGQTNPYRQGTAQILGGRSHEGGGVSLGSFGEAERGEFLGILSKKQTTKFGKPMIDLFSGLNKGDDNKMLRGLSGLVMSAMPDLHGGTTNVNVEKSPELGEMLKIMKREKTEVLYVGNKRIERLGNKTRIVHIN